MGQTIVALPTVFKVGVFWFVVTNQGPSRLVSLRSPFDIDNCGNGLQATSFSHVEAWSEVQRIDRSLAAFPFDSFPRGRLEFLPRGRRWLLSVDKALSVGGFTNYLIGEWHLPSGHLTVKVDPHYCCSTPVADP